MAQAEGYQAFLLFIVQLPDIRQMTIYRDRFPELVTAITTAKQNGVRVLAYDTMTGPDQITLGNEIPFDERAFSEINLNSLNNEKIPSKFHLSLTFRSSQNSSR